MAKKKKSSSRKSPPRRKKTATKKVAKKRTAKGASKPSGKTATSKRNSSVDSLLKRFAKERAQHEAKLEALRKKKAELEEKTRKYQQQVAKMAHEERDAEAQLGQLDKQRDQEVKELLATLGVQLDGRSANSKENQREQAAGDRFKHTRDRGTVSAPNGRNDNS